MFLASTLPVFPSPILALTVTPSKANFDLSPKIIALPFSVLFILFSFIDNSLPASTVNFPLASRFIVVSSILTGVSPFTVTFPLISSKHQY